MQVDYDRAAVGPRGKRIRHHVPKGDFDLLIEFNALGHRDRQNIRDSTGQDYFTAGDSFTFGWGVEVEDRYSDRLAALLGTRVFNIATPGDLLQYRGMLRYARDNGATIERLIVGVCMDNDLWDYEALEKRRAGIKQGDGRRPKLRGLLRAHSAIFLASSYELQRYEPLRMALEKAGIARGMENLTPRKTYDEQVIRSSVRVCCEIADDVNPGSVWFVIIPSTALWIDEDVKEEEQVHEAFVASLREAGLQVLDLRPVIAAAARPLDYYFVSDPHWNAEGHALVARTIAEWVGR